MASPTEGEMFSLTYRKVANLYYTVSPTIKILFRQSFPTYLAFWLARADLRQL